jgi:hypothetical protein
MSIYNDFPINHQIWNVSDPIKVRDNYHRLYKDQIKRIKQLTGADSEIYPSSHKHKKYMVFNGVNMSHFGDIRYESYDKHQDEERRQKYLKRFNKHHNSPYSPYQLSLFLLW